MTKQYLVLSVEDALPEQTCFLYSGETLLLDFTAALSQSPNARKMYLDITRFAAYPLTLKDADGNPLPMTVTACFPQRGEIPGGEVLRPAAHYTTALGWTNDPNGLVYANGVWHMFYQHNPCSTRWGNMTWNHAVSTDLCHWQEKGDILFPDELGVMFSGSAVVDEKGVAGFGKGAILLFYTAAGGGTPLSKGQKHTQCLAYSADGGTTFTKYAGNPIIPNLVAADRDPKVEFSPELDCWVMALYLDGVTFALFTSGDLLHWREIQRLDIPEESECPGLYRFALPDGTAKWVLIGAHDRYLVGSMTAQGFVPEQPAQSYHISPGCSYAAQNFFGTTGRCIRMAWGMNPAPGAVFNSQMGLPVELFLRKEQGVYRLGGLPAPETAALCRKTLPDFTGEPAEYTVESGTLDGCAADISLQFGADCPDFTVRCFGMVLTVNPAKGVYRHGEATVPLSYERTDCYTLRVIFDTLGLEAFAHKGLVYSSLAQVADRSCGLAVSGFGDADIQISVKLLGL